MADRNYAYHSWQVPAAATPEDTRLGWLREQNEEGQAWLKSQRGYADWKKALDVISGEIADPSLIKPYQSQLNTNRLKHNVREIVSVLSDIRPMWGYNSDNDAYVDKAGMMNKLTRAVYLSNFFDRSIRGALQYAAVTCTGYIRPVYKRAMYGTGRGDIYLIPYGAPSILPFQMPQDNDLQSAYAVDIVDEMPIAMAHAMFPFFQDRLRPTSASYWYGKETRSANAGANVNMFRRMFGLNRAQKDAALQSELYLPIHYCYVIDLTINTTDQMIPMGEPGTPWYYEVPNVGSQIPTFRDPLTGAQNYRLATEQDARLYPYRRLIIWAEGVVLYDGPSFDWHGMVPAIPLRVDDWPWEGIGFSLVRDGYDQQCAINELERGAMNIWRTRLDQPLGYDINSVSRKEAKEFDAMQPRARIGFDGSMVDRPFVPILDQSMLSVPEGTMDFIEHMANTMDHQMGKKDVQALAALRSASPDDLEKLFDVEGPIVKDISRSMERGMRDLGEMTKYLFLEYYTTPRVMQYVGADGVTPETFDYDPSSLVPSHLKGENTDRPSSYNSIVRARNLADNLRFFITPNSMHEIVQMSRKLLYLQLKRTGFPMDSRTLAEVMNIPNFGNKPEGNTVFERWIREQEMAIEMMARAKELGASLPGLMAVAAAGAAGGAVGEGQPAGGSGPNGGPTATGGRAPTGQVAPHIVQKDGGARSTISESR